MQQNQPSHSTIAARILQLATDIDRIGFGPDAMILTAMAHMILDQRTPAEMQTVAD